MNGKPRSVAGDLSVEKRELLSHLLAEEGIDFPLAQESHSDTKAIPRKIKTDPQSIQLIRTHSWQEYALAALVCIDWSAEYFPVLIDENGVGQSLVGCYSDSKIELKDWLSRADEQRPIGHFISNNPAWFESLMQDEFSVEKLSRLILVLGCCPIEDRASQLEDFFERDSFELKDPKAQASPQLVITLKGDQYSLVGAMLALYKGYSWITVSDLSYAVSKAKQATSICLAISPNRIDNRCLNQLFALAGHNNFDAWVTKPFGIFTGRTLEAVSRLLLKTVFPISVNNLHMVVSPLDTQSYNIGPMREYNPEIDSGDALVNVDDPYEAFLFEGHSDYHLLYLSLTSILCGLSTSPSDNSVWLAQRTHRHPMCFTTKVCERTESPLPACKVKASHVLVAGCRSGDLKDDEFPRETSISLGFIDGWAASCIASVGNTPNISGCALLYSSLLRSGFSLGEVVKTISNLYVYTKIWAPGYLLIGDPNFRLAKPSFVPSVWRKVSDMEWELEVSGDTTNAQIIMIDEPEVFEGIVQGNLIIQNRKPDGGNRRENVAVDVDVDQKRVLIILCSDSNLASQETRHISILPRRAWMDGAYLSFETSADKRVLTFSNSLLNALNHEFILKEYRSCHSQIENLQDTIDSVGKEIGYGSFDLNNMWQVDVKLDDLEETLRELQREVIRLISKAFSTTRPVFRGIYLSSFALRDWRLADKGCPYCLDTVLYETRWQHRLLPFIQAKALHCSSHGFIMSGPLDDLEIALEGETCIYNQQVSHWTVRIRNPSANPLIGVATLATRYHIPSVLEPEYAEFHVEPYQEIAISFVLTIKCAKISRRHSYLSGLVLANMNFFEMSSPIYLIEAL